MIEKELYIIRHGQTDHNHKGIVQGKGVNLPLNECGKQQAQAFYEAHKHIPFEAICTSSLLRAQETIYPFRALGLDFKPYPELDEISWGEMEGKQATMESSETFQTLLACWKNGDIDAKPPGGESPRELQERQQRFINLLVQMQERIILISMHGRAIRSLLCTLTNTPLSKMEEFPHVNLTLYKVNMLKGGQFEIERFNEQGHLKHL